MRDLIVNCAINSVTRSVLGLTFSEKKKVKREREERKREKKGERDHVSWKASKYY